jgi:hypothetical protein
MNLAIRANRVFFGDRTFALIAQAESARPILSGWEEPYSDLILAVAITDRCGPQGPAVC